jgi:hypothetical protein
MSSVWSRLSFRSPSSSSLKTIKVLWSEYVVTARNLASETDIDILKLKAVAALVDVLVVPSLTRQQLEELMDEVDDVVAALLTFQLQLFSCLRSGQLPAYPNNTSEEVVDLFEDISTKITESVLRLCRTSEKMTDKIQKRSSMIDLTLKAVETASSKSLLLSLLTQLRHQCLTRENVRVFAGTKGFARLASQQVTSDSLACHEKIVTFFISIIQLSRTATADWANSSTGSDWTGNTAHRFALQDKEKSKDENVSLAAKGLNLAVNVIGEILKLTPIAGNWARPEDTFLKDKDVSDDDISSQLELIAVPADTLADESQRISAMLQKACDQDLLDVETGNGYGDNCSSSDGDNSVVPSETENAPSVQHVLSVSDLGWISSRMIGQGVFQYILKVMDVAISHTQALDLLSLCQLLFLKNASSQLYFRQLGGYTVAVNMLSRIFRPVSHHNADAVKNSPDSESSKQAARIQRVLLEIIADDDHLIFDHKTGLPTKGGSLNNIYALQLLRCMFESEIEDLIVIAIRLVFILLKGNPLHVVALEEFEVAGAVCSLMVRGAFSSGQDTVVTMVLIKDLTLLLQYFAVALSCRDNSVFALLLYIGVTKCLLGQWTESGNDYCAGALHGSPGTSRCQNCEDEAVVQCIHDTCLREKKFRFCKECDRVFHKPAMKKAHIRVPVTLKHREMLHTLRSYQTKVTAPAIIHVTQELESRMRLEPLEKLDDHMLCIILAALRGILDDRRCRLQSMPITFLDSVLCILRLTVCLAAPAPLEVGAVDCSQLADSRDDVCSSTCDVLCASFKDATSFSPPEDVQTLPRRCTLSLIVQCLVRLLLVDQHSPVMRSPVADRKDIIGCCKSERMELIETFRLLGGDGLLVFMLVTSCINSSPVGQSCCPLTSYDRQYIIWTLREIIVTALVAESPHTSSLVQWLLWLLGNSYIDGAASGTRKESLLTRYTDIPSICPIIGASTRLNILQELRMLIAGSDDAAELEHVCSSLVYEVPVVSSQYQVSFGGGKRSRNVSFDNRERQRSNTTDSGSSTPSNIMLKQGHGNAPSFNTLSLESSSTVCVILSRIPSSSVIAKKLLHQVGLTQLLVRFLFEDLCSLKLRRLVDSFTATVPNKSGGSHHGSSAAEVDMPSDIELEEWANCLVLLIQLMCSSNDVKGYVDSSGATAKLSNFLMALTFALTNISSNDWHLGGSLGTTSTLNSLLSQVLVELCVGNGRFLAPCRPFVCVNVGSPTVGFSSTNNHQQASPELDSFVMALLHAILRFFLTNIRLCTEFVESDEATSVSKSSVSQLAPFYFVKHKGLLGVALTLQPAPLSLRQELLAASMSMSDISVSNNPLMLSSTTSHASLKSASVGSQLTELVVHKLPSAGDFSSFDAAGTSNSTISAAPTRKRSASMRSKLSSSSLQNLEGDYNNSTSWELESSGVHSHHSTGQLSAVFAVATSLRSLGGTPNASISGDLTPRKVMAGNKLLNSMLDFDQDYGDGRVDGSSFYFPLFETLDASVSMFSEKLLLLFHDVLLYKCRQWSAEMEGEEDDATVDNSEHAGGYFIQRHALDMSPPVEPAGFFRSQPDHMSKGKQVAYSVGGGQTKMVSLARLLLAFLPPNHNACVGEWFPQYSKLALRSKRCAALLLSLCLLCKNEVRSSCLSVLSNLVECNQENQNLFGPEELQAFVHILMEEFDKKTSVIHLLGQLVKYNIDAQLLSSFLQMLCVADNQQHTVKLLTDGEKTELTTRHSTPFSPHRSAPYSQEWIGNIMYVLGTASKRKGPASYFCFSQESATRSGLLLTPCPQFPERKVGFSVCCWLRLGCLGCKAVGTLFQLAPSCIVDDGASSDPEGINAGGTVMDAYFRTIFKRHNKDVPSGENVVGCEYADGTSSNAQQKVLQLCLSFSSSVNLAPSRQRQAPSTAGNYPAAVSVGVGIADRKTIPVVHGVEASEQPNGADNMEWAQVSDSLFKNVIFDDPGVESELLDPSTKTSIRQLCSSFARIGLPDFIVEYDWSEIGDWHLLCLSVVNSEVTCSIDGKKQTVLSWSKTGYVNHELEIQKSNFEITPPVNKSGVGRSPLAPKVPIQRLDHSKNHAPFKSSPGESKLNFEYPSNITAKNALAVAIGGQPVERNLSTKLSIKLKSGMLGSTASIEQRIRYEGFAETARIMLTAYATVASGFVGNVGEFIVIEGSADLGVLASLYQQGPDAGLLGLKAKRLTGAIPAATSRKDNEISSQPLADSNMSSTFSSSGASNANNADDSAGSSANPERKRSFPGSEKKLTETAEAKPKESSFFTLFSSPASSAVVTSPKSSSAEEKVGPVKVVGNVVAHHSHTMEIAMKALGGFRVFYPLLVTEPSRQIACLRIIHDIALSSDALYAEYLSSHVNKVIAYCCHKTAAWISSETIQVISDVVCVQSGPDSIITRVALLSLLFDVAIKCALPRPQLGRAIIEWAKNICDDSNENCGKCLEALGVTTVLALLSAIWSNEGSGHVARNSIGHNNEIVGTDGGCDHTARPSRSTATVCNWEKFRLQISCGLFLRVLINGSSGQQSQLDQIPVPSVQATQTSFSVLHLSQLLGFVHSCLRRLPAESADVKTQPNSTTPGQSSHWYFRRPDGARSDTISNVLSGWASLSSATSGIYASSLTSRLDIADENAVDWRLTAAVIALDSLIGALDGPLSPVLINMLKSVTFPGGGQLWYVLFDWMGHERIDIRARAIKLVGLTLSSPNGTVDSKAIGAFEKINGFVLMADQLALYPPDATTMELLLCLLFWRFASYTLATPAVRTSVSSTVSYGQFDVSNSAVSKIVDEPSPHASRNSLSPANTAASSAEAMNTGGGGGGLLSLFSWNKSSSVASAAGASSASKALSATDASRQQSDDSVLFAAVSDIGFGLPTATTNSFSSNEAVEAGSLAKLRINTNGPTTIGTGGGNQDLSRGLVVAAGSGGQPYNQLQADLDIKVPYGEAHSSAHHKAADATRRRSLEFEIICISQMFQVICKVLHRAQSPDLVSLAIKQVEHSIHSSAIESLTLRLASTVAFDSQKLEQALQRTRAIAEKNAETLFMQKDWLIWISECILSFRRRIIKKDDHEHNDFVSNEVSGTQNSVRLGVAGFSPLDSESVQRVMSEESDDEKESYDNGGRPFNTTDSVADGSESGQSSVSWSVGGSSANPHTGHSQSAHARMSTEQLEALAASYSDPLLSLVEKLLSIDMRAKPSYFRRWGEILRLSTPEAASLQEWILFDVIRVFENFPLSTRQTPLEVLLYYLRNIYLLLEQCLEKVELSLDFCVRCVQALHALIYKSPPELRSRLKETGLMDMRNLFIVRCFLVCFHGEGAGDLFVRSLALSLIHSSLHNYITVSDAKLLSPANALLYILSLFLEATDELGTLAFTIASGSSTDALPESGSRELTDSNSGSHPQPMEQDAVVSRIVAILDALKMLLALVQSCAVYSPECKKCLVRLTVKLPGDPDDLMQRCLLGHGLQPAVSSTSSSTSMLSGVDGLATDAHGNPVSGPGSGSVESHSRERNFSDAVPPAGSAVDDIAGKSPATGTSGSGTGSGSSWWSHWLASGTGDPAVSTPVTPLVDIETGLTGSLSGSTVAPSFAENSLLGGPVSSTVASSQRPLSPVQARRDDAVDTGVTHNPALQDGKVDSVVSFIEWFCATERSRVQSEFKSRVNKEFQPVLRQMERMHDRNKRKQIAHESSLQDKLSRDKTAHEKITKDGKEKIRASCERCTQMYLQEWTLVTDALANRIEKGNSEFHAQIQVQSSRAVRLGIFKVIMCVCRVLQ